MPTFTFLVQPGYASSKVGRVSTCTFMYFGEKYPAMYRNQSQSNQKLDIGKNEDLGT